MVAVGFTGLKREDAALLRAVADVLRPPAIERQSQWAERAVELVPELTERPGKYDPDYWPFTRDILDVAHHFPHKRGAIIKKPAQVGVSTLELVDLAGQARHVRGRMLYVISTKTDASDFVAEKFNPILKGCPEVAALFQSAKAEKRRAILLSKPYRGGRVDFVGAGSPAGVSSRTYQEIWDDEYEQCIGVFPKEYGDLFKFLEARQRALRGKRYLKVWSHPRKRGEGIDKHFTERSTMHHWVFTCPHTRDDGTPCGATVKPCWALVHYTGTTPEGKSDPETAELRCPACQKAITDAQRSIAVWAPAKGGTGRFESELPAAEQAQRPYAGLAVNGLCDPWKSVVQFARSYAACTSDEELMTFFNLELGEEFAVSRSNLTVEMVKSCLAESPRIVLPGGNLGVRYLVVGADAQFPPELPTLYATAMAFAATGMMYIVAAERLQGFAAFYEWLRHLAFPVDHPPGYSGDVPSTLGVRLATVDTKWETGAILDNLRGATVYSSATNARVDLLGVQFEAHLKRDNPVVEVPMAKQLHPTLPHMPPFQRFQLNRHAFVDRVMNRWATGRVTALCRLPEEFPAHVTANVLRPKETLHGWMTEENEWELIPKARDDWNMGLVYGEAGAAVKLGLDRIHLEALLEAERERSQADEIPEEKSFFGRRRRHGSGGYWGRGT